MNAGNSYLAFIILSMIVNIFILTLLIPLCWNRRKSIYTSCTERCNEGGLQRVLQIAYIINTLFLFLSCFIWLILGLCDDALPVYHDIFHYDSQNTFSYSTGAMIIATVANIVGFGAVSWCWGQHKYYEKIKLNKGNVAPSYNPTDSVNDDSIDYYQKMNNK